MPTKRNKAGYQQPYVEKGHGDDSGEYRSSGYGGNSTNINHGRQNAQVTNNYLDYQTKDIEKMGKGEGIYKKLNFTKTTNEGIQKMLQDTGYNEPDVQKYLQEIDNETAKGLTDMYSSPERTEQDKKYIAAEIDRQNSKREIKKEHKAVFIIGLPASGKSSVANPIINQLGAYEIDPDIFKENYIPEYNVHTKGDGIGVSRVHKESSQMAKEMQNMVIGDGSNLVIPTVGGDYEKTLKKVKFLKDNGYDVDVVLAHLPLEKALQRNMSRYLEGKAKGNARLVKPELIYSQEGKTIETYISLIKSGLISNYGAWSTDVKFGEKPILIEKSKDMMDL